MGRYLNIIGLSGVLLTLVGCQNGAPPSTSRPDWYSYNNQSVGYFLEVPIRALISWKEKSPIDAPQMGFGTYPILTQPLADDYDIGITQVSNPCTSTIMGTNTIQNYARETGGNTVLGIVTGKGYPYEMHTFDDSLCMPPYHPNDEGNYENNHVYDGVGAYVLCSEKGEKTVLICISQMTDNPQLAEEIFSTFKWLP